MQFFPFVVSAKVGPCNNYLHSLPKERKPPYTGDVHNAQKGSGEVWFKNKAVCNQQGTLAIHTVIHIGASCWGAGTKPREFPKQLLSSLSNTIVLLLA